MKNYPNTRLGQSKLAWAVASALALGSGGASLTYAQDQEETVSEVVVTGSRIVRRDYQSNSPIVTVDSGDFESQTGLNIESYLNQLPTYNPAASPVTSQGDVQISPVNSVGIASISLRGFGPNRNLVLVDGKRPTPINALMVTDINSIPSALISRVETITGGASAVYGADAVGGVTNFILRDDFEGLELDTQYGVTDAGDGTEYRVSAVIGANLVDGNGNVTFGVEKYSREEALERERDIFTDRWSDPNIGGGLFVQGVNGYSCVFNCPTTDAINAVFADRPAGTDVFSPIGSTIFRDFLFNADGTIFVPGSQAGMSSYTGPVGNGEYEYQNAFDASVPGNTTTHQSLKWNNQRAFASAPQERHSFFASGSFDLNDSASIFVRGTMAESETETLLFGTNAIFGWEGAVPFNPETDSPVDPSLDYYDPAVPAMVLANPTAYANPDFIPTGQAGAQHPVPTELAVLLMSRQEFGLPFLPLPDGDWIPAWNPDDSLPPRSTFNTNSQWQLEAGINFELPFRDWTGEAYVSHGQSQTYNNAEGNLSLARYREIIALPDYGRNAAISGNSNGASPGFGAADVTCTSGFYDTFFGGDQPLSEDCYDAVNATLQTRSQNTQDIVELNFQGSVMELPAGDFRMAAGYQHRDNESTFVPDILQSTVSFTDQVVGVYPTGYLDASTKVSDFYVEALIPLISGAPGMELVELELGARFSDYEAIDDEETTWKALLNWQINDWARIRGGFNRSTRAPNVGELFLNSQEIFQVGGNNFGDPCGLRSTAPYGAGGTGFDPELEPGETQPVLASGQTPEGAASARLICESLMGEEAANQFYNVSDASGGGGSAFNWVQQEGNPNLTSEKADNYTFGLVATSPSDNPWLSGLTASLDWYRVEIDSAIMLYSVDFANFRCYGETLVTTEAEADAQAASPACQLVPRNAATGGALTTSVSYDNAAIIETSGMDVGLNWFGELADLGFDVPGGVTMGLQATILDYYRTKQSPASYDVETDWAGSLGPNLSGTNGGAYDYRLFANFGYVADNWNVSLRWRFLPEVYTAGYASQQAIIENNNRVAAGGEGLILSYTPTTEVKTDSYSIVDLSFNWTLTDNLTLRGGISNLFDTDPVEVGSTTGYPVGTDLASVCGDAPGCQNPGSFSLPGVGGYNAGYYDTLGRSMFIGLKAEF